MNALFENVWPRSGERRIDYPPVNIWAKDDDVVVSAELPGVKAEDLDLSITKSTLTIKGERKSDEPGEGVTVHRQERLSGSFAKTVKLPEQVDAEKASASYEHGVLTVTLPKSPEAKPKQITVKG
jgi:HSP20 family protein